MENGSQIIIAGVLNTIHEDDSCWVVLPDGQNIHTSLKNCSLVEVPVEMTSDEDGLEEMKNKDLFEICAAEGVKYQQPTNKAALVAAIRASRASRQPVLIPVEDVPLVEPSQEPGVASPVVETQPTATQESTVDATEPSNATTDLPG